MLRTVKIFTKSAEYFYEADNHLREGLPGIGPANRAIKIADITFSEAMKLMESVQNKKKSMEHPEYQDYRGAVIHFMTLDARQMFHTPELKKPWDMMIRRCTSTNSYNELVG